MSTCGVKRSNTGVSSCKSLLQQITGIVIVPELNDSGTANSIALASAKTKAAWVAKFDAAAQKDRFYPIMNLENVEFTRADSEFETFNSGRIAKVRNGLRTFVGYAIAEGSEWFDKVKDWSSAKWGAYFVDKDGNILYKLCSGSTALWPVLVDNVSFDPIYMNATDSEVEKIKIQFNIRMTESDGDWRVLGFDDLTPPFDPNNDFFGLVNVTAEHSSITTTGFTTTLTDYYGEAVENLVITDFALAEVTPTPGSITITSVTETSAGVYVFVIPAQTSADVLKLTPTKSGYDFSAVPTTTITIP